MIPLIPHIKELYKRITISQSLLIVVLQRE